MKTYSDEILYLASKVHLEGVGLAGSDHSIDDFKTLLTTLGSSIEVFLKDHVYTGARNSRNFFDLIEGLEALGLPAKPRNDLHTLRQAYNAAKHDPTYDAPIWDVIKIFADVRLALDELRRLRPGDTDQPAQKILRRLLWFAAWDHYIGGDTEVGVFLPAPPGVDMPWSIETIYVKMEAWDDVKRELSQAGSVCLGRSCLATSVFDFWKSEGDFLDAGTFEGDLRDMITVFARHERVEDILPWLKRESDEHSMLSAALFAVTDVTRFAPAPQTSSDWTEAIVTIAASDYAAPTTSRLLRIFAKLIAGLIGQCDPAIIGHLAGPTWVSARRYLDLAPESIAKLEKPPLMILRDGRLVVRI